MSYDRLNNIKLLKHLISKDTKLTSTEKLVAIALMSHRNIVSMMCCPGLTLLSEETQFDRRTVQRAIKSLILKKELKKLKQTSGKKYIKSQYYFLYDIAKAKEIYEDDDSIFKCHHYEEVENFEFCLSHGWF